MTNRIQNRHRLVITGVLTLAACAVPIAAQQYPPPQQQDQYPQQQPVYAQQQVNYPPQELDRLTARIALYPDPLLAQIFAAATYPDQIQAAANWSDQHHYLTGGALAQAINNDRLYFDPSVQALLPFPSVLQMMASDMAWTTALGDAYLSQGSLLEDSVQRLRQQAYQRGYLRSNNQVIVQNSGDYIQVAPYDPGYIVVPYYDPSIFYGSYRGRVNIGWGFGIRIGSFFNPWGWGGNRFDWDRHALFLNNSPFDRRWDNRVEYHHPYEVRAYDRPGFVGGADRRDNQGRDSAPYRGPAGRESAPYRGPAGRESAPQPQINRGEVRGNGAPAGAYQPSAMQRSAPGQVENHTLEPRDARERQAPQSGKRSVETHRNDNNRQDRKQ